MHVQMNELHDLQIKIILNMNMRLTLISNFQF